MQTTYKAEYRDHWVSLSHLEHPYLLLTVVQKASSNSYFRPYKSVVKKE